MTKYHVYYQKPEFFRYGIMGSRFLEEQNLLPMIRTLDQTHTYLTTLEAEMREDVFMALNHEVWGSKSQKLIKDKGLSHTSMCVGDVLIDEGGNAYLCDMVGWKDLK